MSERHVNAWTMIDSQEAFESCCRNWTGQTVLAVDTEFMRTNTFYPKLGLLQIADAESVYLIDPLQISDWAAFTGLFDIPGFELVMHSAGEDLTVFQSTFGRLPPRLFDTQIAAAYLDMGFSLSYQALVKEIIGEDIPKDETRSDWLQRPLSDAQLQYAALDVEYLLEIKGKLEQALSEQNMLQWANEDSHQLLLTAETQEDKQNWQQSYEKVSNAWRLNTTELLFLQRLCLWREQQARRRNKPRNWIAKYAELFEIAQVFAASEELAYSNWQQVTQVNRGFVKHNGDYLLNLLVEAQSAQQEGSSDGVASRMPAPLPPNQRNTLKQLRQIVVSTAENLRIAPELLARKRWLTDLVQSALNDKTLRWPESMLGWRQETLEEAFSPVLQRLRPDD